MTKQAHVNVRTGVYGWTRWAVLDEHDRVERLGPWQRNLIVNGGLDVLANNDLLSVWDTHSSSGFRNKLYVGDGSTAPANTDTTLANKVGETTDNGGFSTSRSISETGGNVELEVTGTWVFTASVAQNLSEYGFVTTNADTLIIRELFRDGSNNPITISLNAGKKLRLEHTAVFTVPQGAAVSFDIEEYDTGDNLVNTNSYTGLLYAHSGRASVSTSSYENIYATFRANTGWLMDTRPVLDYQSDPTVAATVGASIDAYTPGTFQGTRRVNVNEATGTGFDITGFGVGQKLFSSYDGWTIILDGAQVVPKDDLHTLEFVVTHTWGRP